MSKKFRRGLAVVLALIMCLALAACSSDDSAQQASSQPAAATESTGGPRVAVNGMKVGLSMQTLSGAYFAAQAETFEALCKEQGITCVSTDAQGDMTKQLSDVEDLIAQNCDYIVINPKDPKAEIAATEACAAAGIPVFIMDNSIDPSAIYVAMIQSDNFTLGSLVGEDLAKAMGNTEIRIGMLSGNAGNALGLSRRSGVIQGIVETQLASKNSTNFSILTQGWGNWGQEGGLSAAEDMLTAAPDINVIVTENDDMLLGALQAVEAAGRKDIKLVSVDGQKGVYKLIQDGDQVVATGRNDPAECARVTLQTLLAYNNGEAVSKTVYLDPVSVSDANVSTYYDPNSTF